MLGMEVAGLVLGVLPVLFSAVDGIKQSLGRGRLFFGKRVHVNKLARALLLQQQTLAEAIRLILSESGCDDVSQLDIDPVRYLQDDVVQDLVLDYMGNKNFAAFDGSIRQCRDNVQAVLKKIAGFVPTLQV